MIQQYDSRVRQYEEAKSELLPLKLDNPVVYSQFSLAFHLFWLSKQ